MAMSRADKDDRITRELMRLLLSEDADLSRLKRGHRLDGEARRAYVGRLKALMRTSGIFYDGVGFQDRRALRVHWVRLDGTLAHHRYDAIMDMIARGYTDTAIGQHFNWCDRVTLAVYRKAFAGELTTGLYSDRGGNPRRGLQPLRRLRRHLP